MPTGYESSGKTTYPVLYLLHGNDGVRNDWVVKGHMQSTMDKLISHGDIPPAIVIMPDANTNWYVDLKERMETAFFSELIPHVEKTYRTITTRDGRLIGGLSMGGYGALRYVLKYPEKFKAAALLSPAIYNPEPPKDSSARFVKVFAEPNTGGEYSARVWQANNYPVFFDAFLKKGIKVPMYINSGDDDDFNIESEATRFYELLRANKQPAELRIVDGKHEWPVWSSTLPDALKYIFRDVQRPQRQD
ncbi:alpha/beta hydrolase [Pandoraea norimbergensis]|uniref:alpha/beta hydrolase n=1 Tax=Pandoraea norimbergensis TaxID=93219 RepID=UPI0021500C41|nr:alpha/beta hydrolase-fold protein [Pandoraea norimbergensis]